MSFATKIQDQNNIFHAYTFYKRGIVSFRPIEKLRYTPNMKKHIGMVSILTLVDIINDGICYSISPIQVSINL